MKLKGNVFIYQQTNYSELIFLLLDQKLNKQDRERWVGKNFAF